MNAIGNKSRRSLCALATFAALTVLAPSAMAQDVEPVSDLLATADPAQGQTLTRQCIACHTFEDGGPHRVGPNLWDVVGRPKASREGFNYSPVLLELGGDWSFEDLNAYLANPRDFAPGNRMAYAGVRAVDDRAALIVYMRGLSAEPVDLP